MCEIFYFKNNVNLWFMFIKKCCKWLIIKYGWWFVKIRYVFMGFVYDLVYCLVFDLRSFNLMFGYFRSVWVLKGDL